MYYVGLLAGSNDMDLLARSGVGRDVNRHHFTSAEIDAAMARPVVAALLRHIRFRNTHLAFEGDCVVEGAEVAPGLVWTSGQHRAGIHADLARGTGTVTFSGVGRPRTAALWDLPEQPDAGIIVAP